MATAVALIENVTGCPAHMLVAVAEGPDEIIGLLVTVRVAGELVTPALLQVL